MSARRGQAREMIANQTLGAPVSVTFTLHKPPTPPADGGPLEWRLSAADSGGGLFCDTGVHAVDIIEYVMVTTTTHFASVEKSRFRRKLSACLRPLRSRRVVRKLSACLVHGRASRWWM